MHIKNESPIWGIEDQVLVWNESERKCLARAAALLGQARDAVGPDTDLGTDLGKAEVVLRDYADGALIETRTIPIERLGV